MPEFELEALAGIADLVAEEAAAAGARVVARHDDGVRVRAPEGGELVRTLRTPSSVALRLGFEVPRPRALLGDAQLRRLLDGVRTVIAAAPGPFHGFRFAAAGRGSPVFRRLAEALAEGTGLEHRPDDGTLVLRVRPDPHGSGWEVLVRLTPRPLSARDWRVCNRPGGLNASLAAAVVRWIGVARSDAVLNLMCGSGTLLVERGLAGPAARLVGVDADPEAIACAEANLAAAGVRAELRCADVRARASEAGAFDVVLADLPWGDAVGSHRGNEALYPEVLHHAAAAAREGAIFALLTHELKLIAALLPRQRAWRLERERQVAHGGHHPRVLLLRRTAAPPDAPAGPTGADGGAPDPRRDG